MVAQTPFRGALAKRHPQINKNESVIHDGNGKAFLLLLLMYFFQKRQGKGWLLKIEFKAIPSLRLDLCLFVPCFPAFFDLLISLGQKGLIMLHLSNGPTFSKWPKKVGVLVHSTNRFKIWFKELEH